MRPISSGSFSDVDLVIISVLKNHDISVCTSIFRRNNSDITDREEISRIRRKLSAMGYEWDLTWGLEKLRSELLGAIRYGVRNEPLSSYLPTLRYYRLHIHVDRITCYDRSLLVGQFKVRITLACPESQRTSMAWESDRPFLASSCLKSDEGAFNISIPINTKGPSNQLDRWKIEFEVLHKYPAAPIYTVIARSWVDPITLCRAEAIDLYSTSSEAPSVSVRVNFFTPRTSSVGINLFRTVGWLVVFLTRVCRSLAESRKEELVELDRELKLLHNRNRSHQQALHLELLGRTIETMNKYMQSGSKPEEWIQAMQRAGVLGENSQHKMEAQISVLRDQIEGLRADLMKSIIERPAPVVQLVAGPSGAFANKAINDGSPSSWLRAITGQSPDIPDEPPSQPVVVRRPSTASLKEGGSIHSAVAESKKVMEVKPTLTGEAPLVKKNVSGPLSVKERMMAKTTTTFQAEPGLKKIPPRPHMENPAQVEEEAVEEEAEAEQGELEEAQEEVTEEPPPQPAPAEDVTTAMSNTMSSWWGAVTTAVGAPVTEPPKAAPEALKAAPKQAPPVVTKTIASGINTAPLVKAMAPPAAKKVPSKPVAKKATGPLDPKAKQMLLMKAKQDAVKAKVELIMKLKAIEAKRKAEIEVREKAIVELAKKLPPIDRSKFLGLPGPPPFLPKSKAKPPADVSGMPSALGPPPGSTAEPEELAAELDAEGEG